MPYQPSRTYNLCNHPRFPQASFLINTLYWRLKRLRMPAAMRHTFDREIYHLLSASPILFPRPPDWPPHMQVTGYCRPPSATASAWTPPAALRDFIKRGPPPVYVGFGSYPFFTGSAGMELMRTLERELHAQGERVVFCTGFSQCDATPSDPDRTFLIDAVPHDWLLPRCRWAVHHGGCGTLHAALQAGIPMIAYPYQTDQFFWSRRAATLGVSPPCRHHIQQISASSLARGAVYLQQSGAFAKAAQLAETMRHEPDGADRQATLITSILEHTAHGGRPGQWQPPKASVLRRTKTTSTSNVAERKKRATARSQRISAHTAANWTDADRWDVEFWQSQSPQDRLSALVALRRDLEAIHGDLASVDWSE